jgi:predicted AAA+ superfamily ATPase
LNQILTLVDPSRIYFYRTADGTEIDFVITKGGKPYISVEVKLNSAPTVSKSLTLGIQDLQTPYNYIVASISVGYPLTNDTMVVSIGELMEVLESKV